MKPQPGTQVTLVPPSSPGAAAEAVTEEPGAVKSIQVQTQEKKKATFKPVKFSKPGEIELTWIELEMVDEEDKGVPGVRYEVTLPDGSVAGGTTDAKGLARIEGFEKGGDCKVTFPDLDQEAWEGA